MVAKKKRASSKPKPRPTKAHRASAKAGRPKTKHGKTAAVPRGSPRKVTPKPKGRAAVMAAFSAKMLEEEAEPVAVRSFVEARQGVEASKELNVKTGQAQAVDDSEDLDEETDEDVPEFKPAPPPKLEPLTGPVAVPKKRPDEEFRIATPRKKGKGAEAPTKADLGKIELRMQRGTGDATIGRASPDYLQRSFNRAKETGRVTGGGARKEPEKTREDEFEVAQDRSAAPKDTSLLDFGDVEIAQQTRSGRKKLGKLDPDEDER